VASLVAEKISYVACVRLASIKEHADNMIGGLGALMARVLEICFIGEDSFPAGIIIFRNNERILMRGEYGGTMADEDALKKISDYKGASGIVPCMDCSNMVATNDAELLPAGMVPISVTSLGECTFRTNEDIWAIADRLRGLVHAGIDIKALEKAHGLKYNAQGLLFNMQLRDVHRPIDHYIRDWMHTLVSGGAANVETGHLVQALKSIGIPASLLQEYSLEYVLPKKYGKV
jgi:hypothetical protein